MNSCQSYINAASVLFHRFSPSELRKYVILGLHCKNDSYFYRKNSLDLHGSQVSERVATNYF